MSDHKSTPPATADSAESFRVLVLWASSRSANLGVRVLAEASEVLARRVWGDRAVIDFQDYGPNDEGVPFAGNVVIKDLGRRHGPLKAKLRQYDVILDTGAGDSFADIYGLKRLLWMLNIHRLASRLNIPVVLTPQTIGPFRTAVGRVGARYALKRAAQVQVRDRVSYERSLELGRRPSISATDMVFLLPQPISIAPRDVILNVSGLLWGTNAHVESGRYRDAVKRFAQSMIDDGRKVTLLAHVIENPSADSDPRAVLALRDELGADVEVFIPSTLVEAREVISSGQLLVGSRMHACLNALSTGVPTIPWAYSRKFKPLFDDIGWSHTVDLRDAADPVRSTQDILRSTRPETLLAEASDVAAVARARLDEAVLSLSSVRAPVTTW